ncbi:phytoene desaturase family protein [Butyrivibrio sp. YAB3001]|uniref:phytoene desaturase family protein n=1 Tax=Butyrivibrio sp. YAB3001 TaxID=1520812 RepID=UPI0008F624FE|nr:FAD-dependent oxidoreductase [Butyrivibrio sp. YAB3001]SFC12506.1 Phytoene dehydrogenase-related protein [Butyrivibrio sp. YAB3001]
MKKIVVVGAGVAGLAAGIYARKNGFECDIYEQHAVSGGECTAWNRKGYRIDGSISWLTGVGEGTDIYNCWQETGAFEKENIVKEPVFAQVHDGENTLTWYADLSLLKEELLRISPEDEKPINQLIGILEALKGFQFPAGKPMDLMSPVEKRGFIKNMMTVFGTLGPICSLTTEEYGKRFKSELIRNALLAFSFRDNLAQGVLVTLGSVAGGQAGWVQGGSKKLTDNMKDQFLKLGGKLFCNAKVKSIKIEEGSARGIVLESGEEINADFVVPACDMHVVLKKLLDGKYKDSILDGFYTKDGYRTSSIAQVAFGVDCDLSNYASKNIFMIDETTIAGETVNSCCFTHYCKEKNFAPAGKSIIKTGLTIYDYSNWENLSRDEYLAKKEKIKNFYQNLLHKYFKETVGKVEMVDVTTPLTYERYCGAYKGAYMAFMLTKETNKVSHSGVIEGIDNMFIAGQWLSALGGLPDALVSGKSAIMRICSKENLEFVGVQ